jgi:hypothetical protein
MKLGAFVPAGAMNEPRVNHTATVLVDGTVLLAGGEQSGGPSTELFYPATEALVAASTMINARSPVTTHTATLLQDGRVLVSWGCDHAGDLPAAELYDPSTQSFSLTGGTAVCRNGGTATLLTDGSVLVVGGGDGTDYFDSADLYEP